MQFSLPVSHTQASPPGYLTGPFSTLSGYSCGRTLNKMTDLCYESTSQSGPASPVSLTSLFGPTNLFSLLQLTQLVQFTQPVQLTVYMVTITSNCAPVIMETQANVIFVDLVGTRSNWKPQPTSFKFGSWTSISVPNSSQAKNKSKIGIEYESDLRGSLQSVRTTIDQKVKLKNYICNTLTCD